MDILSYLMGQNSAVKKGMKVEVVTELPATGETNVIYLVPKEDTEENDIFEEYLYVDDEWELIGTTDIDLSSKEDVANKVTSLSASSTDMQYPSAKCVYDALQNADSSLPIYFIKVGAFDTLQTSETIKEEFGNIITDAYSKNYDAVQITVFCDDINNSTQEMQLDFKSDNNTFQKISLKPTTLRFTSGLIKRGAYGGSGYDKQQILIFYINLTLSWNGDSCIISTIAAGNASRYYALQEGVLMRNNTQSYTPTANYHPATKKYVDDAVSTVGGLPYYFMEDFPENFVVRTEDGTINNIILAGLPKGNYVSKTSPSQYTYREYTNLKYKSNSSNLLSNRYWNRELLLINDVPTENPTEELVLGYFKLDAVNWRYVLILSTSGVLSYKIQPGTQNATLNGDNTFTGTTYVTNGSWTFTNGRLIIPTPGQDTHAANKKYVDDSITAAVGNISTVLSSLTTVSGGE